MSAAKLCLKCYSLCLGCVVSFSSFLWLALILYILSQTDPAARDLLMARYLDLSFGLLAFTSSLALVYGAFVESKTWLSVWTLGSATVLIACWTWYFYKKYGLDTPESLERTHDTMLALTVTYAIAILPVLAYYKYLESGPEAFTSSIITTTRKGLVKMRETSTTAGVGAAAVAGAREKMSRLHASFALPPPPPAVRKLKKLYQGGGRQEGFRISIPIGNYNFLCYQEL